MNDVHILQSKGRHLDCRLPVAGGAHVMGILNVTPDSFFDGGRYQDAGRAVERARQMAREGAALIDVGGASSRPAGRAYGQGAEVVSAAEEMDRILPVVEGISKDVPEVWISVDTFRADVAAAAIHAGAHLINDITALRFDPDLAGVLAAHGVPVVLMHSVGLPGGMPHESLAGNAPDIVVRELEEATALAQSAGVAGIILDPGFGFGKTVQGNLALLSRVDVLAQLGYPVLIGVSRKNSIGKAMIAPPGADNPVPPPEKRLFGSLGATAVAVLKGASIVRTHDVKETVQFLRVLHATAHSPPL